ncbi:maleate cis-trans isomerase family protein [Mycobacterium sp. SMC-4]|uniref:maleate cis-trans isomerase family protein n=1 Tax=Mycobacterium sp. SMC-4 TaxID=2857059 RepID=UPI003CFDBED8
MVERRRPATPPEKLRKEKTPMRIGMLTPSSNTCLEPTTYRLLGNSSDVTVHFQRVPVTRISLDGDSVRQFNEQTMVAAARMLADATPDVIVWNGTSGSWLGIDHDRQLCQQITDALGVPATTSTLAMLEACRAFGVNRLALVTPYTVELNARIREVYAANGIEIVIDSALGIEDNLAIARVQPGEVAAEVVRVAGDAHAAAVLCTNLHGAEVVPELEAQLGIPVFDSVAVTLWHALVIAGHPHASEGQGAVFRDGFVLADMQRSCEELLEGTGCDRATLRIDLPRHRLDIDRPAAEALRPGVRPIRRETSLRMRELETVKWLDEHRRNLLQPLFGPPPAPPEALVDKYGVHAQLLGPVEHNGTLVGFFSAHSREERPWTDDDLDVMNRVRERTQALLSHLATT